MGANVSKALGKIFGNKEMRILMLGLDAAGKTSKYIKFYEMGV
jgi:ADP-ribosylation factor protein 6